MITFTKVKYQNFLGTGNAPIIIDLDKHSTTLIVGKNGAGKSTMAEAVSFAAFGKPLRNVNKPKLVNSVNQRECLVELWFTATSGNYLVRRGMKPTIFEVYHNDILIPSPANADDYQAILEGILKLNYKSFKQVVILGSASYVPFMRLTAAGRREIIEDLLDIEVFSAMNALAKEDLQELKQQQEQNVALRKVKGDQVKMAEQFTAHLAAQNKTALITVDDIIQTTTNGVIALKQERDLLKVQLPPFVKIKKDREKQAAQLREYERFHDQLCAKARDLEKDRKFYEEHANCPECEQVIAEEFKQTKCAHLRTKEEDAAEAIQKCVTGIERTQKSLAGTDTALAEETRITLRLSKIDGELSLHATRLNDLQNERTRLLKPVSVPDVNIDLLLNELGTLNGEHDAMSRQRVTLDAATMLLRDNGIKTRVINHYLPIINKTVNYYLTLMDFPILFHFDPAFEESMKSRHRDEFTYELFSEGEKKRIDLALLLTWREIAKLKNSASTNLLILDEVVFDSSLDTAGVDECLKILQQLERDTNIFVISHRTDQLLDKFAHTIIFVKQKGFSRLK